jgi:hypothetical protein
MTGKTFLKVILALVLVCLLPATGARAQDSSLAGAIDQTKIMIKKVNGKTVIGPFYLGDPKEQDRTHIFSLAPAGGDNSIHSMRYQMWLRISETRAKRLGVEIGISEPKPVLSGNTQSQKTSKTPKYAGEVIIDYPPSLFPDGADKVMVGTFGRKDQDGNAIKPTYSEQAVAKLDEKSKKLMAELRLSLRQVLAGCVSSAMAETLKNFNPPGYEEGRAVLYPDRKAVCILWGGGNGVNLSQAAPGSQSAQGSTAVACDISRKVVDLGIDGQNKVHAIWRAKSGGLMYGVFEKNEGQLTRIMRQEIVPGLGENAASLAVAPNGVAIIAYNQAGFFSSGPVMVQTWKDGAQLDETEAYPNSMDNLKVAYHKPSNTVMVTGRDEESKSPVVGLSFGEYTIVARLPTTEVQGAPYPGNYRQYKIYTPPNAKKLQRFLVKNKKGEHKIINYYAN